MGKKGTGVKTSIVTPELFEEVCSRIEDGRSLRGVCEDADMPYRRDVNRYINTVEGASDRYTRAREERAEYLVELAMIEANNENTDGGAVARDRLKVETIKWFSSKLNPKRYGDKTDITSNGNTIAVAPIKWADE